jgi:hypothetical protein
LFENDDTPEDAPLPAARAPLSRADASGQQARPPMAVPGRVGTPLPQRTDTPQPAQRRERSGFEIIRGSGVPEDTASTASRAAASIPSSSRPAERPSAMSQARPRYEPLDPVVPPPPGRSSPQRYEPLDPPAPKPMNRSGTPQPLARSSTPLPRAKTPMPSRKDAAVLLDSGRNANTPAPAAANQTPVRWALWVGVVAVIASVAGAGYWWRARANSATAATTDTYRQLLVAGREGPAAVSSVVTAVGTRTCATSTVPGIQFAVRNDDDARLWVVPSLVVVSTGALQRLRTEAELASLLAAGCTQIEMGLPAAAAAAHTDGLDAAAADQIGQATVPDEHAAAMDRRMVTLVRAAQYPPPAIGLMWLRLARTPFAFAHPGPLGRGSKIPPSPLEDRQAAYASGILSVLPPVGGELAAAPSGGGGAVAQREPFPELGDTPAAWVELLDRRCKSYTCTSDAREGLKRSSTAAWRDEAKACYQQCRFDYEREGQAAPAPANPTP